jgi:beta-glucosidase
VSIGPGQTRHVKVTLDRRDLSCVNQAGDRIVAPGAYTVFVGGGQPLPGAAGMSLPFTIQGDLKLPR